MKQDELYEVEPGTKLAIDGEERPLAVEKVSDYDADGDEWINLIETRDGRQELIEVSDKNTRWSQVFGLTGLTTDEEAVDYEGHHYVRREHNTAATITERSKDGTVEQESLTSVYRAEDDKTLFLSIEKITDENGKEEAFVWFSDKKLKAEQIKVVD